MSSRTTQEQKLISLYEEYYTRVARYVYARIGDRTEAEDIAGEVFLRALESLKSYQERGLPMQAWIFKIAHNLVVDHLRKISQRRVIPLDKVKIEDPVDPVAAAETSIEIRRVKQAMEELTEEQREVVWLRFFGGLSSQEVGAILHKSDGAVREMQRYALEKLRRILNKPGLMG